MIEIVRRTSRNVKHWQNGDMCLRGTAAGMLEAEHQFRRIIGYKDVAPKFHGERDNLDDNLRHGATTCLFL